eukprot:2398175-Pleurochrysis_carterae.AAC.2
MARARLYMSVLVIQSLPLLEGHANTKIAATRCISGCIDEGFRAPSEDCSSSSLLAETLCGSRSSSDENYVNAVVHHSVPVHGVLASMEGLHARFARALRWCICMGCLQSTKPLYEYAPRQSDVRVQSQ